MAHILVIDDDQDILRLLEFTLKRAGHAVTIARDGVEGLAQVEVLKPAAVICDVMMPKMNGYEFCRGVRAKPEFQAIPIIVFSSRFQPIDKQTALDAGATDYLPKSVSPDVLNERIDELLSAAGGPPTARGLLGIFSLRGGVGVTTLAVNLAVGVALAHKTTVNLVGLTAFGGNSSLILMSRY